MQSEEQKKKECRNGQNLLYSLFIRSDLSYNRCPVSLQSPTPSMEKLKFDTNYESRKDGNQRTNSNDMPIYKIIFRRTEMWILKQELKISSRASHRAAQLPAPYSGKHLCWCQVGAWKLTLEADDLTGSSFKFLKSSLHPDSSRLFWIWSRWKLFIQAFNQVMVFDKWWMGLKIQRKTTLRHTNEVKSNQELTY